MSRFVECTYSDSGVNAGSIWNKLVEALGPMPSRVRLYGKDVKVADLSRPFALRDGKQFHIEYEMHSMRFVYVAKSNVFFLRVKSILDVDLSSLVHSMASVEGFLSAMIIDEDYERWQNAESLQFYELSGRSIEGLALKSNGLPPPLDEEVVDISGNPGRRLLRDGYVESIGYRMWLASAFWTATGGSKGEAMISLGRLAALKEDGGLLSITIGCEPFTEATPRPVQDEVRSILFPTSLQRSE